MELSPLIDALRADLAIAAELGDDEVQRAADRLGRALESSLRLRLLDALSQAAHELNDQLGTGRVEVRLVGDAVEFALVRDDPPIDAPPAADDRETARITLRLPEGLKLRAEQAAAKEGVSTNAWLVRAVAGGLDQRTQVQLRVGKRLQGYAES
jgi:HicB family